VTVPFEARDLISGAVQNMRKAILGATNDLLDFRRASGQMGKHLVSDLRRSRSAADDLGSRVGNASDEVRRLGRANVDDIFRRAQSGADELRRSASRADAEIRGMSDSRLHIRAQDELSPVLDGISSKITTIAATAGALVLGGGIKDALFGNVMDYYSEASRSAALLPATARDQGLQTVKDLNAQGIIPSQTEGARQLADIAALVRDKSQTSDFLGASSKMKYIRPDAGSEEINRALSQSADTFRETYTSVADSMMYAYKEVGDRQQDLFDTFWEYSGYFKNTGANSGQMANFLTQSVKEGSFNFDKPADFIKETFGVKALDAGDMEKYFTLRGAGKAEAAKQAVSFTGDINSGEEQRAKGALMALVADLASQSQSELKASLVSLGSATAEDNGSAVLKTFQVPFQPAPSGIAGTTERMVKAQQDANPMQDIIQTRAEIDQQMQELGANLSTAVLPALKEFNTLITENKDEIQELGTKVVGFVSKLTSLYSDHFNSINGALGVVAGGLVAVKGGRLLQKGYTSVKTATDWIGQRRGQTTTPIDEVGTPTRRKFTLRRGTTAGSNGGLGGGLKSISSMTVNASVVYLNESGGLGGSIGGQGSRSGGRSTRRGRTGRSSSNTRTITGGSGGTGSIRARRGTRTTNIPDIDAIPDVAGRRGRVTYRNTARLRGTSAVPDIISDVSDIPARRGLLKGFAKGGTKAVKALGIAGTVAGIGMTGYDLYQASRDDGFKAGVSSTGGSLVGGTAGGILGGVVGSLAGPIGTAVGAAAGGWVGDKLGSLADSSGVTKSVVDGVVSAAGGIKDAAASIGGWLGFGKKEEKKPEVKPPPEAKITFGNLTPEREKQLQETFNVFRANVAKDGLKTALTSAVNESGVKETVDKIKNTFVGAWKSTESGNAQQNVQAVGAAAQKTAGQTQQLGVTTKISNAGIVQGAGAAGASMLGIGTAVKTATDETKQQLLSIQTVTSQSESWGSTIITRISKGMQSKFPELKSTAIGAMGILNTLTGAGSTKSFGTPSLMKSSGGAAYANGDIITRPHIGLVGEAGPEAIIPLSAGRRQRGVKLWERAGAMLGVRAYANGGIVGAQPLRTQAYKAKTYIDDNNDRIGYGAGYAEGIHGSLEMVKRQGLKRYTKAMSKASSLTDAYKIRSTGHQLRRQAAKMKTFARSTKLLGKVVRPVGYAMDGWDILFAGKGKRGRQTAKVAGGIGGGILGGAATGAILGTFLMPGVGTAVGGAIGGLLGTIGGEKLATKMYDGISGFFGRRKKRKKKYAEGGLISAPHMGLVGEAGPEMIIPLSRQRSQRGRALWEQAGSLLGVRPHADGGTVGMRSSSIPVAKTLAQAPAAIRDIVIENINIDFGELAKGITNFAEFAKMLTSPQGRALFRKVFGEELYNALESGG
jgi:SLT domain-containing protein